MLASDFEMSERVGLSCHDPHGWTQPRQRQADGPHSRNWFYSSMENWKPVIRPLYNAVISESSKSNCCFTISAWNTLKWGSMLPSHHVLITTNSQKKHKPKRIQRTTLAMIDKYKQDTKHATQQHVRPHPGRPQLWSTRPPRSGHSIQMLPKEVLSYRSTAWVTGMTLCFLMDTSKIKRNR